MSQETPITALDRILDPKLHGEEEVKSRLQKIVARSDSASLLVVSHPLFPQEALRSMVLSQDVTISGAAIRSGNFSEELMNEVYDKHDERYLDNSTLTPLILRQLWDNCDNRDVEIIDMILVHKNTPSDVLIDMFDTHHHNWVSEVAAEHPNFPIEKLLELPDSYAHSIIKHPLAPISALDMFATTNLLTIATYPFRSRTDIPSALFAKVVENVTEETDPDGMIARILYQNPMLTSELQERLYRQSAPGNRYMSPQATAEELQDAARTVGKNQIGYLLENPSLNEEGVRIAYSRVRHGDIRDQITSDLAAHDYLAAFASHENLPSALRKNMLSEISEMYSVFARVCTLVESVDEVIETLNAVTPRTNSIALFSLANNPHVPLALIPMIGAMNKSIPYRYFHVDRENMAIIASLRQEYGI